MVTPLLQVHWYNGPSNDGSTCSFILLMFDLLTFTHLIMSARVAGRTPAPGQPPSLTAHDGVKTRTFKSSWADTVATICDFRVAYFNSEIFRKLKYWKIFLYFDSILRTLRYSFSKILRSFGKSIMETLWADSNQRYWSTGLSIDSGWSDFQ